MKLEKTERLNELFTYYKKLLTDKQVEYFMMYYYDDYSLAEIAQITQVSRNAVYDQLKKVEEKLYEYEEKLKLSEKSKKRLNYLNKFLHENNKKYIQKVIDMDVEDE